jgi:para-nitrobenzyl esterase
VGKGSFYEKEFYPVEEPMDEDCLYLNVWTPAQSTDEKLPVIFWVHGGAFMTGYGHSAHFDGEHFARQGVILVTINYRLNIFAWMTHPELTAESEHHSSGNYGLLDQIFALEWTRRNIAAFGGDPDNITIAGQSAGAMSIQVLLTTPLTKGMVSKAIMQSGGGVTALPDMHFPPLKEAEERTDLSLLGVSSIEEARQLSWQELLARWAKSMPSMGLQRTPVVDGWVLPADLKEMAAKGDYRHVPCLIGYTAKEGIPAAPSYQLWADLLAKEYGPEKAARFLELCGGEENFQTYSLQDCFTEHCRASAESWALLLEEQGAGLVYTYCLDRELPGDDRGPFHASDLWYVFKTFLRSWRPWTGMDYELAYACNTYWAGFAKTGVPQGEGLPQWTPYTRQSPMTMELGEHIGMVQLPENKRVEFRKNFLLDRQF